MKEQKQEGAAVATPSSETGPTWVDGIGPPLEQIAEDWTGGVPDPTASDILALIAEVKRLRAAPVEQVRRLAWDKLVMDCKWHEYAIADVFDVEHRVHALGQEIVRLLGPPSNVRAWPVTTTSDAQASLPVSPGSSSAGVSEQREST